MPTETSYAILERWEDDAYRVVGQGDHVPGGCFYQERISPILHTGEDGVEYRVFASGYITANRKHAYVLFRDFHRPGADTVGVTDHVTVEVTRGERQR